MNSKQAMIAGVFAAIGASLCCVAPLLLLSLGLGGAWVSSLTLFQPVRPLFVILTLLFVGLAFRSLYLIPKACAAGEPCSDDTALSRQRFIFWLVAVPLLGLLAFPWFAPWFY